jgi:hypothetical protein
MDYDYLHQEIERIQQKYGLLDFNIDAECIYKFGDLSEDLGKVLTTALPEKAIQLVERLADDEQTYIATLSTPKAELIITADTHSDWLPEYFWQALEEIPIVFNSSKRFYSINPAIGLMGLDAWCFCGTEDQLQAARREGLPLLLPGENYLDTTAYRQYGGS